MKRTSFHIVGPLHIDGKAGMYWFLLMAKCSLNLTHSKKSKIFQIGYCEFYVVRNLLKFYRKFCVLCTLKLLINCSHMSLP